MNYDDNIQLVNKNLIAFEGILNFWELNSLNFPICTYADDTIEFNYDFISHGRS